MTSYWHLAIESSGLGGSVALFHHNNNYQGDLHSQQLLPNNKGSVQTLAPAIEQLLRDAQIQPKQLGSLSATCGPGSFTGLRVGLATAKMLAWSLNIPVMPVDTLEAIAIRFVQSAAVDPATMPQKYRLVAAINAFRRQVFTSSWSVDLSRPTAVGGLGLEDCACQLHSTVVNAEQWLSDPWQTEPRQTEPSNVSEPLWISGGAIGAYAGIDSSKYHLASEDLWQPQAEQVGLLGLAGLAHGRAVTAVELSPNYIRASAAEENIAGRTRRA